MRLRVIALAPPNAQLVEWYTRWLEGPVPGNGLRVRISRCAPHAQVVEW